MTTTPANDVAAIFDLDKILRSSVTLLMLSKGLDRTDRAENLVAMAGSRATAPARRRAGLDEPVNKQAPVFGAIAGRSTAEVQRWARQLATREILPRVHPQVVEMIARAHQSGMRTILVTGAPDVVATAVAATLDIDDVAATISEIDDGGHYTGRPEIGLLDGPTKLAAVEQIAQAQGVDLARSHVYSDQMGSPELLDAAGFPHVINPTGATRARALERGWAIHEIRSVHWLWVAELPGLGTVGALGAGFIAGLVVGRRHRLPGSSVG